MVLGTSQLTLGVPFGSKDPMLHKAADTPTAHNHVVNYTNIDELQRLLQLLGYLPICGVGLRVTAGWLCTNITAAGLRLTTSFTISRGWTDEESMVK